MGRTLASTARHYLLSGIFKDSDSLKNSSYSYKFAPGLVKHEIEYGELTAYKKHKITLISSKEIDLGISN